ncbi:hypothetical protein EJB05_19510, partial [Eragrostis curvula]
GTQLFSEILVPLRRQVPQWLPPIVLRNNVSGTPASPPPSASPNATVVSHERNGVVTGLAVGLGVVGALWLLQMLLLACLWRRLKATRRRGDQAVTGDGVEGGRFAKNGSGGVGGEGRFLASDISEWLDKYRVFKVEELENGTGGFDDAHLIQGSVYKANIDGEVYAVKKMKWDACEELKILQKARVAAWMDPVLAEQTCPPGSVASVVGVARACLHRDPSKRPSMVDVAYTLSKADEHFADYSGESLPVDSSGEVAAR